MKYIMPDGEVSPVPPWFVAVEWKREKPRRIALPPSSDMPASRSAIRTLFVRPRIEGNSVPCLSESALFPGLPHRPGSSALRRRLLRRLLPSVADGACDAAAWLPACAPAWLAARDPAAPSPRGGRPSKEMRCLWALMAALVEAPTESRLLGCPDMLSVASASRGGGLRRTEATAPTPVGVLDGSVWRVPEASTWRMTGCTTGEWGRWCIMLETRPATLMCEALLLMCEAFLLMPAENLGAMALLLGPLGDARLFHRELLPGGRSPPAGTRGIWGGRLWSPFPCGLPCFMRRGIVWVASWEGEASWEG